MSKPRRGKKSLRQRLQKSAKVRSQRRTLRHQEAFVEVQIQRAWDEWEDGKRREAVERLEEVRQRHPHHHELLEALACFAHEQGDYREELVLCRQLVQLAPDRPEPWYFLGSAHLVNMQPALARRVFRHAVSQWPNHEFADGARGNIELAEQMIREAQHLEQFEDQQELYELAEAHEEVLVEMYEHRPARVLQLAGQLLERWPAYVPARNNLAEGYYHLGQLDQAIAVVRGTVEMFPDNMYAAACLVRFLALDGQFGEAAERCAGLPTLSLPSLDHLIAALDACSRTGMHEQVLQLIELGDEYLHIGPRRPRAELHHLAGVAASHLGQRRRAREHWEAAIQLDPSCEIAAENLADSQKSVSERHGPWPFETARWVLPAVFDQIQSIVRKKPDERAFRAEVQRLFQERPRLAALLASILRYGGPSSCQFVFGLAKCLSGGPLVEPLYEFACGQRGSDELRLEVLHWLQRQGLVSRESHRIFFAGKWQDILSYETSICHEPIGDHSPAVQQLLSEASKIRNHDPAMAERLLRQALQREPDAPDVLNNLADALECQGRMAEAEELVRDLQERFPDYFFGRLRHATSQMKRGEFDAALRTVSELLTRPQIHIAEFRMAIAFCVQLYLKKGNLEEAQGWLRRLEKTDPDYSRLDELRALVDKASAAHRHDDLASIRKRPGR